MNVTTVPVDVKEFECPICLDYFVDPVILKICQHVFCKSCITTKECGVCKQPITQKKFVVSRYFQNKADELRQIGLKALEIPEAKPFFSQTTRELFLELHLVKNEADLKLLEEVSQSAKLSNTDSEAVVLTFLRESVHKIKIITNHEHLQIIFSVLRNLVKVQGYESPLIILRSYILNLKEIDFNEGKITPILNLSAYNICKQLLTIHPDSEYTDTVLLCLSYFLHHPVFPEASFVEYFDLIQTKCESQKMKFHLFMELFHASQQVAVLQPKIINALCELHTDDIDLDRVAMVLDLFPPGSPAVCKFTSKLVELIKKHQHCDREFNSKATKVLANWIFSPIHTRPFALTEQRKFIMDQLLTMKDPLSSLLFSKLQQMRPTDPGFMSLFRAYLNALDDKTKSIDFRIQLVGMMPIGAVSGSEMTATMLLYFMLEKIHSPDTPSPLIQEYIIKMVRSTRYIPPAYGISSLDKFLALEPINMNPNYQALVKQEWKEMN